MRHSIWVVNAITPGEWCRVIAPISFRAVTVAVTAVASCPEEQFSTFDRSHDRIRSGIVLSCFDVGDGLETVTDVVHDMRDEVGIRDRISGVSEFAADRREFVEKFLKGSVISRRFELVVEALAGGVGRVGSTRVFELGVHFHRVSDVVFDEMFEAGGRRVPDDLADRGVSIVPGSDGFFGCCN